MSQSHWISVEEKYPAQAVRVLVYAYYHNVKCVMIACIQGRKWLIEGIFKNATVTHWMPMVEPPSTK